MTIAGEMLPYAIMLAGTFALILVFFFILWKDPKNGIVLSKRTSS